MFISDSIKQGVRASSKSKAKGARTYVRDAKGRFATKGTSSSKPAGLKVAPRTPKPPKKAGAKPVANKTLKGAKERAEGYQVMKTGKAKKALAGAVTQKATDKTGLMKERTKKAADSPKPASKADKAPKKEKTVKDTTKSKTASKTKPRSIQDEKDDAVFKSIKEVDNELKTGNYVSFAQLGKKLGLTGKALEDTLYSLEQKGKIELGSLVEASRHSSDDIRKYGISQRTGSPLYFAKVTASSPASSTAKTASKTKSAPTDELPSQRAKKVAEENKAAKKAKVSAAPTKAKATPEETAQKFVDKYQNNKSITPLTKAEADGADRILSAKVDSKTSYDVSTYIRAANAARAVSTGRGVDNDTINYMIDLKPNGLTRDPIAASTLKRSAPELLKRITPKQAADFLDRLPLGREYADKDNDVVKLIQANSLAVLGAAAKADAATKRKYDGILRRMAATTSL